ncbi:MAG: hypothetical protein R3E10_19705 [Gemmatimonadota bacterium]
MTRATVVLIALLACVAAPRAASAQVQVAPEVVHSTVRDYGAGLRVSWSPNRSTWLYAEAVEFFQDESGTADPGVRVDAAHRQLNAGLIVSGDERTLQPFAGAGGGWFSGRLTLERNGVSATADRSGFLGHLFVGMRMPRPRFTPYGEMKRILNDGGQWVTTFGVAVNLR